MAPEDGDPARDGPPPADPSAPVPRSVTSDDAFAQTMAPSPPTGFRVPDGSSAPEVPVSPTRQGQRKYKPSTPPPSELESDATVAAPLVSKEPEKNPAEPAPAPTIHLPEVDASLYRADQEIARGGMGRIVAAEDRRLGRKVALKELIDPTEDQLGRFEREALITARLQHPGIVPVYEAGRWPTGEPFFAMKLVAGQPLDRVIADAEELDDRLALLPRVLAATDAIAYAHSQRVIHRDLKPANVLIGDFGETVVIDWGLAKDLDADDSVESGARFHKPAAKRNSTPSNTSGGSTLTVAGAVMGTPAYMAPEQARGEQVDQRADVFALGAMLYHLLAGSPPYNARTATDVIAAAALGRVVPLIERERRAPADLVAIVKRAMAQEPADRYPNAGELADELRRFLTGQLVGAHRYTAMQRVTRFVRKHRAAVTIAVVALVGFAVGGTMAVTRIVRARDDADRERSIAVTRRKAAEHLVDFMISDVKDRLTQIGRLDLLASLGSEVRTYYDTLAKIPGGMPTSDVDRMATAVDLVALAERESGNGGGALASWTEMRDKLAASIGTDTSPATRARRTMIAHFDFEAGTIHQQRGKLGDATAAYKLAKQEFDALRVEAPADHAILLGAADTHDRLGDLLRNDGKVDEAFEEYSEAKAERETAASQSGNRPSEEMLALSTSHMKLGSVYQVRGESATSLEEYRASQRLRQTLYDSQPDNVRFQERLLEVDDSLGELQRQVGDDKGSITTIKSGLPITESLIHRDETNTSWKRLRGNLLANLGFALLDSGDFKGGVAILDDAIEVQKQLAARDPKASVWQVDLSRSYTRAGDGRIYLGDIPGGIAQYQLALDIRNALAERDPKSAGYRRSLAWSYHKLGNAYALQNDMPRAIDVHERALGLRAKLVAEAPAQGGFKNELAGSEVVVGKLVAAKDPARSRELLTAAIGRLRALVTSDAINNDFKDTLAQGLLAQADAAKLANDAKARTAALTEAVSIADEAMARARENVQWPCYLAEAQVGLAELAIAGGDGRAASAAWKKVRDLLEPLASTGRLPVPRKPLLDRARNGR